MKLRNNAAQQQTLSSRPRIVYNRILTLFLIIALVGSTFGSVASAAEETVNSVRITTTDDQNGKLYVEDGSIILTAWADIKEINTEKNVTDEATWTSTSTSIKVVKGVVTASGAVSSATITVKYKTQSAAFMVTSEYAYDEIKLMTITGGAPDKEVNLGDDLKLKAQATKNNVDQDITSTAQWTTSNSAVATVNAGTVTLLAAGTATITVKSKGKSDSIALTVTSPYSSIDIYEKGILVEGPIEMLVGSAETGEKQINAKAILKSGGTPQTITDTATWTSSNAAIVKVDDKGKLTAVGPGTAIVSAKRYGLSSSVTVIVRTEYEAISMTPDKPIYVTLYGSKVELNLSAVRGAETRKDVTEDAEWKIADADQAVAIIVKKDGKVYAAPTGVGTAKITVTYKGLTKSLSITVMPTIDSIEISKDSLEVIVDDTATLPTVTGKTVAGDTKDVSNLAKWSSSNIDVIKIEDGKWKALKRGSAALTAEVESSEGFVKQVTVNVEVHDKILALIPSEETISVVIGREVEIPKVAIIYENGDEDFITDKVTWKSSTPNLLITPKKMKGLLPATATLTGTYLNKTVKVKVTVEEEFTSFVIAPTKISLTLNKSQTVKVTGITKSGKKVTISSRLDWISSNAEHVTVKGASIKGMAEGSGKLTATIQENKLEIPYVITAKLTKLTASATSLTPIVGDQISINLTALYENGKTENVSGQAVWTTNKAAVATVEDGRIIVKGKGSATIKATFAGKSATIRVTVK